MEQFLIDFVFNYPKAAGLFSMLYIIGVINKPVFAVLHKFVDATESVKDNEALKKVEESKLYKAVCYILDLSIRVKLPVNK